MGDEGYRIRVLSFGGMLCNKDKEKFTSTKTIRVECFLFVLLPLL
jgi:hypothetical protein